MSIAITISKYRVHDDSYCSVLSFCRILGWNSESGLGILSRWKSMMRTDKTYRPRRWDRPFGPFNSPWEDGLDSSCFGIWVIFILISDLWNMRWLCSFCLMSAGDRRSFGSFVARTFDLRNFQTFALVIQKEGCQSQSDISESQPLKLLPWNQNLFLGFCPGIPVFPTCPVRQLPRQFWWSPWHRNS